MKLILCIVFPFLLLTACEKEESIVTGEFTVLSYNIAGLPDIISGSTPSLYTPLISELINDYNVVHVQEDFCYHVPLLSANMHPYKTPTSGCVPFGDGLNTFSDYPIYDLKRIKWQDCTDFDCFTPKGFTYSRLEIADGVKIDFYNVHAQAQGYPLALAQRRKNISQLCTYILQHSAGHPALVFGDLNSHYTRSEDTIRALLDIGFSDAWIELIREGDVPPMGPSLSDCNPAMTSPDCEVVDKIFYRNGNSLELVPLEYKWDDERYYYNGDTQQPLSDHEPVYAKFRFTTIPD